MVYKFKNQIGKKFVSLVLVLSILSSSLLPVFAPKAEAFLPVTDVKALVKSIIDGFAMVLAKRMVDDMVKSTVTWANSGFDGKPSFVTDPKSHFTNIADSTAGDFINSSSLGFLCSPFQQNIRLSLQQSYNLSTGATYAPSCTVTGIKGNIDDFYRSFSSGGWDTWFSITQDDDNNPYGAYINASIELDKRVASKVGLEKNKIDWGDGFKSKGKCLLTNPTSDQIDAALKRGAVLPYDSNFGPGECVKQGEDSTPGVVIKEQLNKVLPSGLESLISVEHIEQLISAFANGLLTRFVFGPKGLFGADYADTFASNEVPKIGGPIISTQWIYCANENEICEYEGTKTVRFGSGTSFLTIEHTDSIECTAEAFGAQESDSLRWCEYSAALEIPLPPVGCNDGQEPGSGNGSADVCITPPEPEGALRCAANIDQVELGTPVTWTLYGDVVAFPATYVWHGEGIEGKTTEEVTVTYDSASIKKPTLTFNPSGKTDSESKELSCSSVRVYKTDSIKASCEPIRNNPTSAFGSNYPISLAYTNELTEWKATISGGTGQYRVRWAGDDSTPINGINPWEQIKPPAVRDPETGVTTIIQPRKYYTYFSYKDNNRYAEITVEDANDPTVASVHVDCSSYKIIMGERPNGVI